MRLEFLQTGHHDLRQVTFLVAICDFYGFVQLAFTQCACHSRRKLPRLFACGAIGHQSVDHDTDRPGRHDKQQDHDALGECTHLVPQRPGVPAYRGRLLQQQKRPNLQL